MDAKDLMIGDYFTLVDFNGPTRITAIYDDVVQLQENYKSEFDEEWYSEAYIKDLKPIPLTPEILEKNGFTGGEYKSYTGDVWYLKEEGFRKIGLTMSRKESTLWGEKIKPLSPDSIGHNFAVPNIKYVHELQHALRLCGINKKIEI